MYFCYSKYILQSRENANSKRNTVHIHSLDGAFLVGLLHLNLQVEISKAALDWRRSFLGSRARGSVLLYEDNGNNSCNAGNEGAYNNCDDCGSAQFILVVGDCAAVCLLVVVEREHGRYVIVIALIVTMNSIWVTCQLFALGLEDGALRVTTDTLTAVLAFALGRNGDVSAVVLVLRGSAGVDLVVGFGRIVTMDGAGIARQLAVHGLEDGALRMAAGALAAVLALALGGDGNVGAVGELLDLVGSDGTDPFSLLVSLLDPPGVLSWLVFVVAMDLFARQSFPEGMVDGAFGMAALAFAAILGIGGLYADIQALGCVFRRGVLGGRSNGDESQQQRDDGTRADIHVGRVDTKAKEDIVFLVKRCK